MLRHLIRAQMFAQLSQGWKGPTNVTQCMRLIAATRGCSSDVLPTNILESDFSLGQSLDLQLRSPTLVRIKHGSPYSLHAEYTGPGPANRFEVSEVGDMLSTVLNPANCLWPCSRMNSTA